jgi:hypothetical protein
LRESVQATNRQVSQLLAILSLERKQT